MASNRLENKVQRISALEQLLLAHPQGLSQAEIARRLGVHRSTIGRYFADIRHTFPVLEEDGKLLVDRDCYLNNVKLTVHEIMVLHLAARLFSCRMDKKNPHASSAMRKIGNCLRPYSQCMSEFILATARSMECDPGVENKQFIAVLEKITRGWSDGVWLRLEYFSQKTNEIHTYNFAPWFVQPYAAGSSIYAVGYCREKDRMITLKIEHIRKAELLAEKYAIPATFDPETLFEDAWGIWYSDETPVEVALEFSTRVADRVRETVWHKNQQIESRPAGKVVWKAKIAEPLEMLPWIRGWGSDCEVIAPKELREFLREEARKLGMMYG